MSQVCRSQMSAVAATIQSGVGCGLLAVATMIVSPSVV